MADHSRVPIKAHVDAVVTGLRWWIVTSGIVAAIGFVSVINIIDKKNSKAIEVALGGMEKATGVAFEAAEAKGLQHNGVIEYFRQLLPNFITWQTVMSFLTALGIAAAVYVAFIK